MKKETPVSLYRPDIDGLRAVAILAVLFYHANLPGFSGGFVGVDVFFVLSGFLITQALHSELSLTGRIGFSRFYARRILRLFPALWTVILSSLLLWAFFCLGVQDETRGLVRSIKYAVFGLANIFFFKNTGGYFDGRSDEMPLLHFWSLAVEEQFYLVWPFLLFLLSRLRFGSLNARLIVGLSGVVVLSFLGAEFWIRSDKNDVAFYMMPLRAWELGAGGLSFYVLNHLNAAPLPCISKSYFRQVLKEALCVFGLALIIVSIFIYDSSSRFPGVLAFFPVIGTVFLVVIGGLKEGKSLRIKSLLSNSFLVGIGLISYGWYLWHWPLLAMAKVWQMGDMPPWWARIGIVAFSAFLAWMSLVFVERPVRYGQLAKKLAPKTVILLGVTISLLVVAFSKAVQFLESSNPHPIASKVNERPEVFATCPDFPGNIGNPDCTIPRKGDGVSSRIFVWGNSFSGSIFPMFEEWSLEKKVAVTLLGTGVTPPLTEVEDGYFRGGEVNTRRDLDFNEAVLNEIETTVRSHPEGRVSVVIAARWPAFMRLEDIDGKAIEGWTLDRGKSRKGTVEIVEKGLRAVLRRLETVGVHKVLIMLPYPEFPYETLRCHIRKKEECFVTHAQFENYRKSAFEMLTQVSSEFGFSSTFDPAQVFCGDLKCPQVLSTENGPLPVTYDRQHLSVGAARHIYPFFKDKLEEMLR